MTEAGDDKNMVPTNNVRLCPHCQREVTFVSSWSFRGLWGYNEVHTYECPEHGPIFVSSQTAAVGHVPDKRLHKDPDSSDRDSLVSAPRRPKPTLNADAIAVPEPDSD
jgi:hypothetical protein